METVFAYTRQNAIDDGIFVDITETAKEAGFKYHTVVTRNLFDTHIQPTVSQEAMGQSIAGRLWDVVWMASCCFRGVIGKIDGNMAVFPVTFSGKTVDLWAFMEATSPDDPTPAINIMLPEDY
jgi:hypothetical protein